MAESIKERCNKRWLALKNERSSWVSQWRDISEVLLPRSGRFLVDANNKGDKGYRHILDGTGTRALRTLAGGMMAGLTSPARPWFRLTTLDPELDEDYEVKAWMSKATEKLQMVFNRSNVYRSLHTAYEELGAFGTSATIVLDDFDRVIHCMPLTIGEYCITSDARGRVNALYREFRLTAEMMVAEFGYANCSTAVQQAIDQGNYDTWFHVVNAIEPRNLRDPRKLDNKNMAYRSVYFEPQADGDKLLRESGFRQFPVLGARWLVTGGDIYGTSPGMEAVGGLRSLQANQLAADRAVEYQSNPPIIVPTDLKDDETDILPGGITYADNVGQAQIIKPLFDGANFRTDTLQLKIQDTRQLINEAFYKDIFLMLTEQGGNRMTATEVAERHEEKMLMLGPVLDRLNTEMLDPLIALSFSGFRQFPVLGARWLVTGGDIYGTSPGMEAVGGLRSLQANQLAADRAVEYQSNPPIIVPTDLKDDETDILPGGITYADNVGQAQIIKPLFDGANFRTDTLQLKIQDTRQLINEAFYKDIFLMLTEQGGNRMTATEVAERHEEKMLMLGPVLDRLNTEMLDPLIALSFERLLRVGALPEVPEALQGVELNVEYTSILAQSQKAITTNAVDRFTNNLGVLAGLKPELLDKFDADYWADYYADALGIDPRLIVPGKQVALIRQQRAQQQAQQQQLANAEQASAAVRNVGGLDKLQSMAPNEIQGMFSGY